MTFFFLYTQFSSIIEKSHLMLNQLQNFLLHVHLNSGTEKFLTTIFNTSFFTLRSFFSSLFISNFCNYVTRNANIRKKKTCRLNRMIFGMETAFWFHVVNVLLHSISSILFTKICYEVIGFKRKYCLLAGIFFAIHPIHTESKSFQLLCFTLLFFTGVVHL